MRARSLATGLVVVTALWLSWRPAAQAPPTRDVFQPQAAWVGVVQGPEARRIVRVDLEALAQAGRERRAVELPLPDGDRVVAALAHFTQDDRGYFTAGRLVRAARPGTALTGEVALTVVGDRVVGRLVRGNRLYRISRMEGSAFHAIEEIDQAAMPLDGEPLAVDGLDAAPADAQAPVVPDTGAFVDLLLLYTPAARVAMGGTAAVQAEAIAAVNISNFALQESGLGFRYRAVYIGEVSYVESGSSTTDLGRLRSVGDGILDEVHGLRDTYDADVVTLLTQASDVCGVGYVMGPGAVNSGFAAWAFNVTIARVCASAGLSLAHEIGHNLGLQHDRVNAGTPPAFDFAYGFAVPGVARSVMAYACTTGGACPRQPIYSTPLRNFPATATTAGTPVDDNTRALQLTVPVAVNFRDSTCGFTVSPTRIDVPLSGGTGAITVTTGAGCQWNAVSNAPTVAAITSGATSTGSGAAGYSVSASSTSRETVLTIAGQSITVAQGACTPALTLAPGSASPVVRGGGTVTVQWTMPPGCPSVLWSLFDDAAWATTSTTFGAGSASADYTLAANTTDVARTVTISLSSPAFTTRTLVVTQLGASAAVGAFTTAMRAAKGGAGTPLHSWTPQQGVSVTLDSAAVRTWTAASTVPWLEVVGGSGTGDGRFYVRIINPGDVIGGATLLSGGVTVSVSGLAAQTVPVTLTIEPIGTAGIPFGNLDTPVPASTVSGAVSVTGWALVDATTNVASLGVWRDAVPGIDPPAAVQPNGWVYVGPAVQVPGARPDVAAAFPGYTYGPVAGWGHMVLTNMLPHQPTNAAAGGQGVFRLHVTATAPGGLTRQIGTTSVTVDNDAAVRPFGTLDTPALGGSASSLYATFGWALARGSALIPTNGSTMAVFIDGQSVGRPVYNQCRGSNLNGGGSSFLPGAGTCDDDIASLFASRGHLNVAPGTGRGAIGAFVFDTRLMTNGMHSIAWSVTDNQGRTEGIGSRIFTVTNGVGDGAEGQDVAAPVAPAASLDGLPVDRRVVIGRRSFALDAPWELVDAAADGTRFLRVRELDRLELDLGGPIAAGYVAGGAQLSPLPVGASLDLGAGRFAWAPPAGYLGRFDLEFVTATGRVPVSIELIPQVLGPEHDGVRMFLDQVTFTPGVVPMPGRVRVAGWALDPQVWNGPGVGAVHVWAERADGAGRPQFLGAATLGLARPDVARAFGPQFHAAGFTLDAPATLAPGVWRVTAYIWVPRLGGFADARTATVEVR